MPKIPRQRGSGQTGGAGGQLSNRGASYSRGGRPSAKGGGTGRKPPGSGCAVVVLAGLSGALALIATATAVAVRIL